MLKELNIPIKVQKYFKNSPIQVFDAWLDSSHIENWFFKQDRMIHAENHPDVDGEYSYIIDRGGEQIEHRGKYLEIIHPVRLSFTFQVPKYSDQTSVVTLNIESVENETLLTLTHQGVLPEYRDRTIEGWSKIVDRLHDYLQSKKQ